MPLQGHSGSAVCRQAAEHLTLWLSEWRTESALGEVAERHIKLTVKLLSAYTVLVNTKGSRDLPPAVFILVVGVRIFILLKWDLKKILKLKKNYIIFNFVLSWIHSIRSLSNLEASVMCKWWLLLHSID